MPELSTDFIVDASADRVGEVIGRRFDRIGDWSTAICGIGEPRAASFDTPATLQWRDQRQWFRRPLDRRGHRYPHVRPSPASRRHRHQADPHDAG
jgi:hypothetical protein